jgi:hypothetical protein
MQSSVARERRKPKRRRQERRRQLRLTQERLKQVLKYFPTSGRFRWRVRQGGAVPGREAGSANGTGYQRISIDTVTHLSHRLAWLYVHGVHPSDEVDHKNGKRGDNRIANLRDLPREQNAWNSLRRNPSGFIGVHRRGDKWRAIIKVSDRRISLGTYDSKEQAGGAYQCAARLLRGEYVRNARRRRRLPALDMASLPRPPKPPAPPLPPAPDNNSSDQ